MIPLLIPKALPLDCSLLWTSLLVKTKRKLVRHMNKLNGATKTNPLTTKQTLSFDYIWQIMHNKHLWNLVAPHQLLSAGEVLKWAIEIKSTIQKFPIFAGPRIARPFLTSQHQHQHRKPPQWHSLATILSYYHSSLFHSHI